VAHPVTHENEGCMLKSASSFCNWRWQLLIGTTYVIFQLPVKLLIPALCEILPQVGTMKSGNYVHFAFIASFLRDEGYRFMS
jgi:hypothetical protein